MIKIENFEATGFEHAIRGMRNPMNSWEKSDSCFLHVKDYDCSFCADKKCEARDTESMSCKIGSNDHALMTKLAKGGPVHAKYRRMITVYVDITAPLYWWKEFDTYKVGTVANSCSTMHKIHDKEFTLEDFSREHLLTFDNSSIDDIIVFGDGCEVSAVGILNDVIDSLNHFRKRYLETNDKKYWWQMIQLLPSSYNQKRTVMLNYEVLHNIYTWRKNHKLDEWVEFCKSIETLPYSDLITMEEKDG